MTRPMTAPTPRTTPLPTAEPTALVRVAALADLATLERPIVIAHAGGENEFPGSTLFAYASSVAAGADMIDCDVHLSADGSVVVQHDATVERLTGASGDVGELTLAELQRLDNAHWWTPDDIGPGHPAAAYLYRGIRTGVVAPPEGFGADDFTIPTLDDVLGRCSGVLYNIEIKGHGERATRTADAVVELLAHHRVLHRTTIGSFDDDVLDHLHRREPTLALSPGPRWMAAWLRDGVSLPEVMRTLQLPPVDADGSTLLTDELIARAHDDGRVIWVWPNDRALENEAEYRRFLRRGIDGLNSNSPRAAVAAVRAFLAEHHG